MAAGQKNGINSIDANKCARIYLFPNAMWLDRNARGGVIPTHPRHGTSHRTNLNGSIEKLKNRTFMSASQALLKKKPLARRFSIPFCFPGTSLPSFPATPWKRDVGGRGPWLWLIELVSLRPALLVLLALRPLYDFAKHSPAGPVYFAFHHAFKLRIRTRAPYCFPSLLFISFFSFSPCPLFQARSRAPHARPRQELRP